MSRGNRKKEAQAKIAEFEVKKRNGLLIAIASLVIMAVLIAVKLSFQAQGAEWASSSWANMAIFMLAIFATGFAGYGTQKWRRSKEKISQLRGKRK